MSSTRLFVFALHKLLLIMDTCISDFCQTMATTTASSCLLSALKLRRAQFLPALLHVLPHFLSVFGIRTAVLHTFNMFVQIELPL